MRVIILSKAPVVGQVKTRLQPEYSAEQATELHKLMLKATLTKVCSVFNDVWLAVDDVSHPYFAELKSNYAIKLKTQGKGDLGQRLKGLCEASFGHDSSSIMFLGTDSPHVMLTRYRQVQEALVSSDVVIGPVEDGGYDLIALSKPCLDLFDGVHWGTHSVFEKTMNIINGLKLKVHVLEASFDLDRAQDIRRAPPASW